MFSFFDRLSTGWSAAKACLEVLRRDKKLVLFPLLSGLSCLVVLASFAIPLAIAKPAFVGAFFDEEANVQQTPVWFWLVLFAFYFVNYFVIYFFNSALVYCALSHFQGEPASVGLILKLIENANEKVGSIVAALLGGAWSVVTYFVVPVLVVERVGPMTAIQRSWKVLTKTWGESIGGHAGVGWALLPFWLIGIVFGVLGFFALSTSVALGVLVITLTVAYMLVLGLVDATLKGILVGALYLY